MSLPVLTALEPDPRRPGTLRVEVDGVRFGAVPETLAHAAGLAVGRPVDAELQRIGFEGTPLDTAVRLAKLAQESGLRGVVASPHEVAAILADVSAALFSVSGDPPVAAAEDPHLSLEVMAQELDHALTGGEP